METTPACGPRTPARSGCNAAGLTAGRVFAGNEAIRTAALYLGEQRGWSRVDRRDEVREEWEGLRATAARVVAGMAIPIVGSVPWRPRGNALCGYCPFADACSAAVTGGEDDAMTAWVSVREERHALA